MLKRTCFILLGIVLIYALTSELFGQQEVTIKEVNIDLSDAQKVAEEYFELLKTKDYDRLFNMHYRPPDYDPSKEEENKMAHIELMKIYNEELGDIVDYKYKAYEWHKPIFKKHWDPGKIPFVDKPSADITKEPPSLTLTYEVQYTKDTVDTTIEVLKQGSGLKVRKFGINYPLSFKAMQRIMNLQGKVKEQLIEKK